MKKSVEKSLSELEQLYRTAPVGLCFLDHDFRFLRVNEYLAAIHGYPVEAHYGRTLREIFPALAGKIEPVLNEVLESGRELLNVDFAGNPQLNFSPDSHWRASFHPATDEDLRRFEQLIADISSRFVNITSDQVDTGIETALGDVGEYLDTDLNTVMLLDPDRQLYRTTHEWVRSASSAEPMFKGQYWDERFPWLLASLEKREIFIIDDFSLLPDAASSERTTAEFMDIRSLVSVPFGVGEQIRGYIALNTCHRKRTWSDDYVPRLRLVGEVFGSALLRRRSERELEQAFTQIAKLNERLESENLYLRDAIEDRCGHDEIVGESQAIKQMLAQAERVAATDATVLLLGETGTGKELLAHEIHRMSARRERSMVIVNCGALPTTLIEAELFGREKGAYTGALSRQVGRFELADESTLFLDEIGELPPELQVRLLRVLQDGSLERLGSTRTIKVNVRVIAATNQDLAAQVRKGSFRVDLYYRLNVFPVTIPPLRERREDIPLIVWSFVKELSQHMGKCIERIPVQVMDKLQRYPWPGNVRELRNIIERAMILTQGKTLQVELSNIDIAQEMHNQSLEAVERAHIESILEQTKGRIAGKLGAAEILGIKPNTLRSRMERLGVSTQRQRHL